MTEPTELTKSDVDARVRNWLYRIDKLYDLVRDVLIRDRSLAFSNDNKIHMCEELMQQHNLEPVDMPTFEIKRNGSLVASFQPKGLWIIGANGRIDIFTEKGAYILVDISETMVPLSIWKLYSPDNRKKSVDFDKNMIENLVK